MMKICGKLLKLLFKGTVTGIVHKLGKKTGWKSMRCSSYKTNKINQKGNTVEGKELKLIK